jgi:hypothetical protein
MKLAVIPRAARNLRWIIGVVEGGAPREVAKVKPVGLKGTGLALGGLVAHLHVLGAP